MSNSFADLLANDITNELIEDGFDVIYDSMTGCPVGKIDFDTIERMTRMELSINPLIDSDDLAESMIVRLLAINSRPDPMWQNLTEERLAKIVELFPRRAFRYLIGKLLFETFNHSSGMKEIAGRMDWFHGFGHFIESANESALVDSLQSLLRIDAVFSLRKVRANSELTMQMDALIRDCGSFDQMAELVDTIESEQLNRLAIMPVSKADRLEGNKLARLAMLRDVGELTEEQYIAFQIQAREADVMRQMRAANRSQEERLKVQRKFAALNVNGKVTRSDSVNAALSYANLGEKFDKQLAVSLLAKIDTNKAQKKIAAILKNGGPKAAAPKTAAKPADKIRKTKSGVALKLKLVNNKLDL